MYLSKSVYRLMEVRLFGCLRMLIGAALLLCSFVAMFADSATVEMQIPTTTSITGTIRVSIPFAFTVGDKKLEAGEYYVGQSTDKTVLFRSVNGKQSVIALTNAVSGNRHVLSSRLVFRRYGSEYFLSQAWLRSSDEGREFFVSTSESRAARGPAREAVTVSAAE